MRLRACICCDAVIGRSSLRTDHTLSVSDMVKSFHPRPPKGAEALWDIMAKAMLIRSGGQVIISKAELETAAKTQCSMTLGDGGQMVFKVD